MDIEYKEDEIFERYKRCLEKYDEKDFKSLKRHLSSQIGGEIDLIVKDWLLSTEIGRKRGHQALLDKKLEIIMSPLEDIPIEINYPHPIIRAIVNWRLEIGK